MSKRFPQTRQLLLCCLCSILAHVALAHAAGLLGRCDFGRAVDQPPAISVTLADQGAVSPAVPPAQHDSRSFGLASSDAKAAGGGAAPTGVAAAEPPLPEPPSTAAETLPPGEPAMASDEVADDTATAAAEASPVEEGAPVPAPVPALDPVSITAPVPAPVPVAPAPSVALAPERHSANAPTMLKTVSDYLAPRYEKLSYQLTVHGLPVAQAELESKNDRGVTSITLRVRSNVAFSGFYPVEDVVETRHVDGRYIMTSIRQREGSFNSEESFTINPRKRSVTWFDLKNPRSLQVTVPTENVLDTLSGIYYLRNRQLQIGRSETLYLFDSESYAEVPVEILRREEVSLPGHGKVSTLVLRPLQKGGNIFRRAGDLVIWMTDDDSRVPVKIETTIALGRVTAWLVSAETRPYGNSTSISAP